MIHVTFRRRFCAIAIVCTAAAFAGDLNPPAGPIGPTMKPLSEVEPRIAVNATNTPGDADSLFKITAPGSYYLIGNIAGVSGKSGIEIASSGVTLDLNGFNLLGVAGSLYGVVASVGGLEDVCVKNGSVRGWGQSGVFLHSGGGRGVRVADVRSTGNTYSGIQVGVGSSITGCAANGNGTGIAFSEGCSVSTCTAADNAGDGFYGTSAGTIIGCAAISNDRGIAIGNGGTISGCSVRENASSGISATAGCTISGCTVSAGTGFGIVVVDVCTVSGNTCAAISQQTGGWGAAIRVGGVHNRIEGNSCTNSFHGIEISGTANIVMRNTCAGNNTNWLIAPFNAVAPIVSATMNGAQINGNSYAGSLGSTDPNANFTY